MIISISTLFQCILGAQYSLSTSPLKLSSDDFGDRKHKVSEIAAPLTVSRRVSINESAKDTNSVTLPEGRRDCGVGKRAIRMNHHIFCRKSQSRSVAHLQIAFTSATRASISLQELKLLLIYVKELFLYFVLIVKRDD